MKIVHLSTHQGGGAGIACLRLHQSLLQCGVNSNVLSVFGEQNYQKQVFSLEAGNGTSKFRQIEKLDKLHRYLQSWKVRLYGKPKELFSFPDSLWEIETHPLVAEADLIHLHWVAGMVDTKRFFRTITKPVVWTLHDAWPFSGGFHYESYFDAKAFAPISSQLLKRKQQAYEHKNITIVSPSRYLLDLCRLSNVFSKKRHICIPNGAPSAIYYKRSNRSELRKAFGIAESDFILLFASSDLDYFRKGMDILLSAFLSCPDKNFKLFVAGKKGTKKLPIDDRIKFLGHVSDEGLFAELLTACDALVHVSREDNSPNVILESLLCGTPVLAICSGGVGEMISDGINGILCRPDQLQQGFDLLLETKFNRTQIASSAKLAFSCVLQSERFVQLYRSILQP